MKGKTSIGEGGAKTLLADSKGAHSKCSNEWVGITDTYPASALPETPNMTHSKRHMMTNEPNMSSSRDRKA